MKLGDMPSNQRVFICEHVMQKSEPPQFIGHDPDGDITFVCKHAHDWEVENAYVVGVGHMLDRRPGIAEVDL